VCGSGRCYAAGCAQYVPKFGAALVAVLLSLGRAHGILDAPLGRLLLAVDALGVDPQQDIDAVPGPLGDLRRCDPGVEPGRDGSVPERVGDHGQRRGSLPLGERLPASRVEDLQIDVLGDDSPARADEDPAPAPGREGGEVRPQEPDKIRVDGYGPPM
jgi:hypothetical protein